MEPARESSTSNVARLREISATVVRYGFGELLEQGRVLHKVGLRFRRMKPEATGSPGRRLRLMLSELGPTFIKLGQVLSTRGDLLPQEVIRELSQLQDQAPPVPFEEIRRVIESGLGRPLEDAFSDFEPEPIASASIAQAHRASTRSGMPVIVKVQRPDIRDRIRADLDLLRAFARLVESVVEEQITSPTGIVDEFEKAILGELDFRREAANVTAFRRANEGRDFVRVPHVIESLSSRTVLTLERLEGVKVTDFDPERHDRETIARNVIEAAFVQLFEDGLFHGDPHPGNLLVLEGNRIGIIDLGLIGRLSRPMQETVIVMSLAIALKDANTLARLLYKVGVPKERVSLSAMAADIQVILDRYLGLELSSIDARSLLGDMLDLAQKYKIRIPREYAVLGRASITIEGVVRKLCPDLDVLEMAMPYAQRLLKDRFGPRSVDGAARRLLLQMQGFATDLPSQFAQVMMDLEKGRLNVTSTTAEEALDKLVSSVRLLAIAIVSSAVGLGAIYWLAQTSTSESSILPLSLLIAAGTSFTGAFAWLVGGIKPRKLRLGRRR